MSIKKYSNNNRIDVCSLLYIPFLKLRIILINFYISHVVWFMRSKIDANLVTFKQFRIFNKIAFRSQLNGDDNSLRLLKTMMKSCFLEKKNLTSIDFIFLINEHVPSGANCCVFTVHVQYSYIWLRLEIRLTQMILPTNTS